MNVKHARLTAAAFTATAAAAALLITGCSSNSNTSSSPSSPGQNTSAPSGHSTALVDGKEIAANFTTTCARQGNTLALALADTSNSTYGQLSVGATVTGSTVSAVAIAGTKGGSSGMPYAVGFGHGQQGGNATLSKDGNTFHITGEGVGAPDMSNPMAGPKTSKFDVTFACSTIVGG